MRHTEVGLVTEFHTCALPSCNVVVRARHHLLLRESAAGHHGGGKAQCRYSATLSLSGRRRGWTNCRLRLCLRAPDPRGIPHISRCNSLCGARRTAKRRGATFIFPIAPAAASLGYHAAYADIALPNQASVGLHEAMGFEPICIYREVGRQFDDWHDVGLWQRLQL